MNVLIVHNEYGTVSGEEAVVAAHVRLLESQGHDVFYFRRTSAGLNSTLVGRGKAFFSGVYSPTSARQMRRLLKKHDPDIVHIHNLFPWISPSVLPECRRAGVPVVMTVHNYRLVCPNGLHMPKGRHEVCERCCGGREYWCVLRNCEQDFFKSIGYTLRTYTARRFSFFRENVTLFACLTEFQRNRLAAEGYPEDRLRVIPNMYPADMETSVDQMEPGDCVAYAGRVSPEKGIDLLVLAARRLQSIPFGLAGSCVTMPNLVGKAPGNMSFVGNLDGRRLVNFYRWSRLLVLCSTWFEGFPMAIVEAMVHGKPVIAPCIGGIPEIVDDGTTGLLFAPGDVNELAEKIQYLWDRPDLCRQMGRAGREKALRDYSPEKYYERLMTIYKEAMKLVPRNAEGRV